MGGREEGREGARENGRFRARHWRARGGRCGGAWQTAPESGRDGRTDGRAHGSFTGSGRALGRSGESETLSGVSHSLFASIIQAVTTARSTPMDLEDGSHRRASHRDLSSRGSWVGAWGRLVGTARGCVWLESSPCSWPVRRAWKERAPPRPPFLSTLRPDFDAARPDWLPARPPGPSRTSARVRPSCVPFHPPLAAPPTRPPLPSRAAPAPQPRPRPLPLPSPPPRCSKSHRTAICPLETANPTEFPVFIQFRLPPPPPPPRQPASLVRHPVQTAPHRRRPPLRLASLRRHAAPGRKRSAPRTRAPGRPTRARTL